MLAGSDLKAGHVFLRKYGVHFHTAHTPHSVTQVHCTNNFSMYRSIYIYTIYLASYIYIYIYIYSYIFFNIYTLFYILSSSLLGARGRTKL